MSEPRTVHIVHLYRKDGSSLFVHPFGADEESVDLLVSCRIRGLYGNEPPVPALTGFRNELYLIGERALRRWNAEDRFLVRFLAASVVFVLVFLFLSIVVRDPVPLLDELVISAAVSIGAYFALVRRDLASQRVERRRIEIRSAIDRTVFEESELVHRLEETLHGHEGNDVPTIDQPTLLFDEKDSGVAAEILTYLGRSFRERRYRRQERRLRRATHRAEVQRAMAAWAQKNKADLPLFCLYLALKRHVEK